MGRSLKRAFERDGHLAVHMGAFGGNAEATTRGAWLGVVGLDPP